MERFGFSPATTITDTTDVIPSGARDLAWGVIASASARKILRPFGLRMTSLSEGPPCARYRERGTLWRN